MGKEAKAEGASARRLLTDGLVSGPVVANLSLAFVAISPEQSWQLQQINSQQTVEEKSVNCGHACQTISVFSPPLLLFARLVLFDQLLLMVADHLG